VLYFDPRDVDTMVETIRRALIHESLRNDMRARGIAQAKKFSWDQAARELLQYLTG
jgi:glycosyltransferase involved in cell wall biosynthesis